jgi:hypothetical protein
MIVKPFMPIDPYTGKPHRYARIVTNQRLVTGRRECTCTTDSDEGALAMTAHSLLSPEQRADLQRARDRARQAATRAKPVTRGKNTIALGMEPPSFVATIQRKS